MTSDLRSLRPVAVALALVTFVLAAGAALADAPSFGSAGASRERAPDAAPLAPARSDAEGRCDVTPPIVVKDLRTPDRIQAGALVIQPTWESTITSQAGWQAVIQQAINEWQSRILDCGCIQNPLPIYFRARSLGGPLARTQPLVFANGCIASDTMTFDPGWSWFVDPTPADDSEHDGPSPPPGYDLLTTTRHELGHAIGWTSAAATIPLLDGATFDPNRLNIPTTSGTGLHVDPTWIAADLMTATLGTYERRSISLYPDAALIARAYGGSIPMTFVDPNNPVAGLGTAQNPYRSLATANASAPAGWPLLLSNGGVNHVTSGYFSPIGRTWQAARGGASVVAP